MIIQVKNKLTKSRNPTEYKINLENKQGELIQVVGDGYCLIEFDTETYKRHTAKGLQDKKLQWYVHEVDFFIPQMVTKHE